MNKDQISSCSSCEQASEALLRRMYDGELSCNTGCSASLDCTGHQRNYRLKEYPLAMVYAPYQQFRKLYELEDALLAGTMFSELNLPFTGARVGKGGKC